MRIENTLEAEPQAVKIIVAAEAGNGKTTLAKTIEPVLGEKVLVVSAEAGLLSLRGSNVDYIELQKKWDPEKKIYIEVSKTERIKHLTEIFAWIQLPEQRAKYKWIFLDSLTEVNQNMEDFLDSVEEFQGPKNTIKKFGELSKRMMGLCKAFRDMPHYSVVMSALVKTKADADNKEQMLISMTGAFAEKLPALFDEIFYLGVMPEMDEATGKNTRQILTQKTDRISFPKDRGGRLARVEPANLGLIVQKLRAKPVIENISEKAKAAAAQVKQDGTTAAAMAAGAIQQGAGTPAAQPGGTNAT